MKKARWHILSEGETLVLARRLPVRMDVSAETVLADSNRLKIAQQVRQDLWRALQRLRGFSPVVRVTRTGDGLHVCAGGQVDGAVSASVVETIEGVLNDPRKRKRWVRHATRMTTITSDEGRADPRGGASRRPSSRRHANGVTGGGSARPGVNAGREDDQRIVATIRHEAASSGGQP
ncbi:hypothetical protein [Chachezhania antarctica]|uniref:hypothetical protein n=1 Tax=Chachezhania antarctica TaxID=2340860 RepID=UPI000EAE87A7|nr:hypothetical protein [Chachezhania antarctica]